MKWEYKTIDQMGMISRGRSKHRPRNDERLFGGPYPFIQTADVKNAVSWEKLSTIEFPCPPLEVQNKIAAILSRYDDLIENYQKQIKLWEEAAQPHVYAKDKNALEVMLVPLKIRVLFNGLVSNYFNCIGQLLGQLRLLTEARDRLLPKLMSGEIEV